jgi:hypothetical protein
LNHNPASWNCDIYQHTCSLFIIAYYKVLLLSFKFLEAPWCIHLTAAVHWMWLGQTKLKYLQNICILLDVCGQYMMWQFNSQNGPMKAKFAFLCTNGCCCLWNIFLVKLCTSWDDGATSRTSLENHFPEYLAITFSRCIGCQKGQKIFVPSGHFLILERAKNCRD